MHFLFRQLLVLSLSQILPHFLISQSNVEDFQRKYNEERLYSFADSCSDAGDCFNAEPYYNRSKEFAEVKDSSFFNYKIAVCYYKHTKDYKRALYYFSKVDSDCDFVNEEVEKYIYLRKGDLYFALNIYSKAIEMYDGFLTIGSLQEFPFYPLKKYISSCFKTGDCTNTITLAEHYLGKKNDKYIQKILGGCYAKLEENEKAFQSFSRLSDESEKWREHEFIAKRFYENQNYIAAIPHFNLAIDEIEKIRAINPNFEKDQSNKLEIVYCFLLRGECSYYLNRYSEAQDYYDRAFQIDDKDSRVLNLQGKLLITRFNFKTAIGKFEEAAVQNPNMETGWFDWGWALMELKKFKEALVKFSKANELTETSESNGAIAFCYFMQDSLEMSKNHIMRAKTIEKQNPTAMLFEVRILFEEDKYWEAIKILLELEEKENRKRNQTLIYYWLSECYLQVSEFEESEKYATTISDKYPRITIFKEVLGLAQFGLGKYDEAQTNLKSAKNKRKSKRAEDYLLKIRKIKARRR